MDDQMGKRGMSAISVVLTVILVALIIGGGTYYYFNSKAEKEKKDLNAQITELQSQVASVTTATGATTSGSLSTATGLYTHKELKYSMTLPTGYVGIDSYGCEGGCNSSLTIAKKISDNSYSDSYIKIEFNAGAQTLDQMIATYKKDNGDILKESDVTIGGVTAKKYELGGMASGFYYLAASGKYNLSINQYPNDADNQKVVDSILSTFKFPQ